MLTGGPAFGDYIVFVDESGDRALDGIDPQYPVFVLLFLIVLKEDYVARICRDLQQFKMDFWGHDEVVLHEHDIRKPNDAFRFLINAETRHRFMARLNALMASLPVTAVAIVIDKRAMVSRYHVSKGPYHYALETGHERVHLHLKSLGQEKAITPVLVEKRGRREDAELELAFRRVCAGSNILSEPMPFDLVMTPKAANSAGLQLADLMARPIGLHYLRPTQPNQAYDIIATKLRRSPDGKADGWGIKILP